MTKQGIERREEKRRSSSFPPSFSPSLCVLLPSFLARSQDRRRRRTTNEDDEHDYHDYTERRRWQASREVAQMRDDENIGSISKFYFGASAERRSYTQFTASRTRFCPRARNFTRFSPLSLSLPLSFSSMLLKNEFLHQNGYRSRDFLVT